MSWYAWQPYVSVAERRRKAQQELKRRQKKGAVITPVVIEGRTIAMAKSRPRPAKMDSPRLFVNV